MEFSLIGQNLNQNERFKNGLSYHIIETRWIECSSMSQYLFAIADWIGNARATFFFDAKKSNYSITSQGFIHKNFFLFRF